MGFYAHNFWRAAMAAGHKMVLCLAMLLLSVFSLRASDSGVRVKIMFPFDSDSVRVDYRNNAAQLSVLNQILAGLDESATVSVTSFSSPDGNLAYNRKLSFRRAVAIRSLLQEINPSVNVELHPGEEAWEQLRESVSADARLSADVREAVLDIIDSNDALDSKEEKLSALPQYKSLYSNYFKQLRYAIIELRVENPTESADSIEETQISQQAPATGVSVVNNGLPIVYYVVSEDFIRPSYMGNDVNMKEIVRLLKSGAVKSMVLEGSASPEGPAQRNVRLAQVRAENLKNYIVGMFPGMEDKISIVTSVSETAEEETFRYLRYARILSMEVEQEPVAEEPVIEEPVVEEIVEEEKPVMEETAQVDTVEEPTFTKTPLFALTTNTLYTVGGAIATGFHAVPLTVGFEVPIGKHWSVQGNYMVTAPWSPWNNNAECAELMHWDLGARWYPGWSFTKPFKANPNLRVLEGWYASFSAGMGYYDFQHKGNGYQGEEALASLGIGYSLCLNNHWSLNFGIGVGPMFTRYRYYEGRSNNQHLMYRYSGTFTYFGVTDARVSLTYLIYYNKRDRK